MNHAHPHPHPHPHAPQDPQAPQGPHAHGPSREDDAAQAEVLDLDAEVLAEHLAAITGWLPLHADPRLIVDLGCGTGAGTFALLRRFPQARVVAVDASPGHLHRLREKAQTLRQAERITTVQADLDAADWPDLTTPEAGAPDLVWASASMHHLVDPDRALRQVRRLLAPDGVFALVELADLPRFLPADAPAERPGLEERCHAATDHVYARHLPHRGADWGPMLTAAGFAVIAERTVTVDIDAGEHPSVARYALAALRRLRTAVAEFLAPADLAALDRLLDADGPDSIARRGDVGVHTERQVWAARRA